MQSRRRLPACHGSPNDRAAPAAGHPTPLRESLCQCRSLCPSWGAGVPADWHQLTAVPIPIVPRALVSAQVLGSGRGCTQVLCGAGVFSTNNVPPAGGARGRDGIAAADGYARGAGEFCHGYRSRLAWVTRDEVRSTTSQSRWVMHSCTDRRRGGTAMVVEGF